MASQSNELPSKDPTTLANAGLSDPLVSVIIPTFNRKEMLREALNSARAQTGVETEIIVIDDGSTDGTEATIPNDPCVRYFRQENAGPSSARNYGMRQARGEFLAFLDSDDLWGPDFLSECVAGLNETDAAFAFANWRIVEHPGKTLSPDAFSERPHLLEKLEGRGENWITLTSVAARDLFIRKSFIMPSGIVFRNSALDHEWDESVHVGEDQLFILEGLFARESSIACTRRILWTYRFHDSNSCTNNPDTARVSRGEIQIKQRLLDEYGVKLTERQRTSLKRSLAASYYDLGYHLAERGDRAGALEALSASWRHKPGMRTLLATARVRLQRRRVKPDAA